jgi:3-hydroxyisobutyrate dehydrogenase
VKVIDKSATIGFIGLGNLGRAMSLNLIEQGWCLRVMDTAEPRMNALINGGALALRPADLSTCEVLCFAVPDDVALRGALSGPNGMVTLLGPGQTVVVHSTILPETARELATMVGGTGANFLDIPVSGGPERAREGRLTLMVGGSQEHAETVRPLLESMASNIVYLGPAGAGSATKLANQLVMFSALGAVHEALELAASYGVGEQAVLQALATGTADTWVGRNWGFFDRVASQYDTSGTPVCQRPWVKDMQEILSAVGAAGMSAPIAGLLAGTVAQRIENNCVARSEGGQR